MNDTVDIPISAGKRIADSYGYDQVVIVARKVGAGGREHVTTYGVNKANCDVAARMGDFFKHKLMKWPEPAQPRCEGLTYEQIAAQQIADRAVVADIESEAVPAVDEYGQRWYDTRAMLDPREVPDDFIQMSRQAIDYALHRGLISAHPQHAQLVRITAGRAL